MVLANTGPVCVDVFDKMWPEEHMPIHRQRGSVPAMTEDMLACREVRWCLRTTASSA